MKNPTKIVLSALPFVLIGVAAMMLPTIREWQAARGLEELRTMPLKSTITVSGEMVRSSRHTFSMHGYGVADVGNLRLAFEDLPFNGSSSSSLTLATDSTDSGSGGSTGNGNRRFETDRIAHGSRCRFGGATFDFVNGELIFDGTTIDATGDAKLVLVGPNLRIIDVMPLAAPAP